MNWMNPRIKMLVARDIHTGIVGYEHEGKHNLPWHIRSDLQWFKAMSLNTTIVIGRKTWESFGKRPLPGRPHIVVTSEPQEDTDQVRFMSLCAALDHMMNSDESFTISGGPMLYSACIKTGMIEAVYVTEVDAKGLEVPPGAHCSYLDIDFLELAQDGWRKLNVMHELDRSQDKYDYTISLWFDCSNGCKIKDRHRSICDSCPREIKLELQV